jgi:hypothetical protein
LRSRDYKLDNYQLRVKLGEIDSSALGNDKISQLAWTSGAGA